MLLGATETHYLAVMLLGATETHYESLFGRTLQLPYSFSQSPTVFSSPNTLHSRCKAAWLIHVAILWPCVVTGRNALSSYE